METKWILKSPPNPKTLNQLKSDWGCNDLEANILSLRNLTNSQEIKTFFRLKEEDIHSPFLMKDMKKAVSRIQKAIGNQEKILIYGDYDVDGTTAVSLVYLYLSQIYDKTKLSYYIPDRYTEGYGISKQGIDFAKENDFSLIIALDCGIKSVSEIDYANELGIDFIICDHHLPDENIPKAVAILNAKQNDCPYPYKGLSGCGVGFKLCQALNEFYKTPQKNIYQLTDLLAISIAADIVPITGENRTLLKLGLKYLRQTERLGLKQLVSNEKLKNFSTSDIVFQFAPKINAAGRIEHGKKAVELLISNDPQEIQSIANQIIEFNDYRRDLDQNITEEAVSQIENIRENDCITVVYSPHWSKGVVGIVAARLVEKYHKPALVLTDGDDENIVGSARSFSDFDIYVALEQCTEFLVKFGGHQAAAGLTLKKIDLEDFKKKLNKVVSEQIQEHQKIIKIDIDAEIKISDLNQKLFNFHQKLAPFGPENMRPVFLLKNIEHIDLPQKIGKEKNHLKFYLPLKNNRIECIGFGLGHFFEEIKTHKFDMVFSIEENHWQGELRYNLYIRDIKFTK